MLKTIHSILKYKQDKKYNVSVKSENNKCNSDSYIIAEKIYCIYCFQKEYSLDKLSLKNI